MKSCLYLKESGSPHHDQKESDVFLLFLRNNGENHFLFGIISLACLLLFNPLLIHSQTNTIELNTILSEANEYFREAMELSNTDHWKSKLLYEKAAAYYEKIASDGKVKNGKLYYNIGNAYFKAGDIGRAILNYLKAEQYIPDDQNLKQNLEYARSRRLDKVEEEDQTRLVHIIFFWHYALSSSMRLILFSLFFLFIWIIACLKLFFKQGLLNFFLVTGIIIATMFLGSLTADLSHNSKTVPGVILANEVIARKGDSDTYERSFQEPLHAGTEFVLLEERRGWYNIELQDGRNCWIPVKDGEVIN